MKIYSVRFAFVIAVTILAWFSLPVAVVAICATVLAALQSKASTLIEISFGPLKAKLEREISDAERLIEKLRSFSAVQAKAAISTSARTGRWASDDDWMYLNAKRFEQALRDLGVAEDQVRDARSDLVWFTLFDFGHAATGGSNLPMHLPPEAQVEWKSARDTQAFMDPDVVSSWLLKWGQMTPEREALLTDMRWVKENQDVKDSAQYRRAKKHTEWSK